MSRWGKQITARVKVNINKVYLIESVSEAEEEEEEYEEEDEESKEGYERSRGRKAKNKFSYLHKNSK